jgi:putative transposase
MKTNIQPLEPDKFYHIYNRGINGTNLFYEKGNYEFFLRKYADYLLPFVETYALCLLPNHFHLLVRVNEQRGDTFFKGITSNTSRDNTTEAFRKFFTSYAMAINKQQNRHGALFERPFRRIHVTNTQYLANLVYYIHANPQNHGICSNFKLYPWSSYERMLLGKPTQLQKEAVLNWFDGKENYVAFHNQKMDLEMIKEMIIE